MKKIQWEARCISSHFFVWRWILNMTMNMDNTILRRLSWLPQLIFINFFLVFFLENVLRIFQSNTEFTNKSPNSFWRSLNSEMNMAKFWIWWVRVNYFHFSNYHIFYNFQLYLFVMFQKIPPYDLNNSFNWVTI